MRQRIEREPAAIRAMFASVARRYDLLNRVLSLRQDVRWRRRLVDAVAAAPAGPVLDLATGTGDVALALAPRRVVAADFCLEMLLGARPKVARAAAAVSLAAADALALPFAPGAFAAVTIAFGARNFADLDAALRELRRVLVRGGVLAVLELQRPPRRAVAAVLGAWNRAVVQPLGRALSDDGEAYDYLPASVQSFPDGEGLRARMAAAGLAPFLGRSLAGGIAALSAAHRID